MEMTTRGEPMILDDTKLKALCERHAETLQQLFEHAKGKNKNSPEVRALRHQFDLLLGMDIVLGTGGYTIDYITGEILKLD